MAKIIYFKSLLNKEYSHLERSNVTLLSVIKDLGIEKESLSIQINGDVPNDIDSSMILGDNDSVVIKRVLYGDSGSKRTLGTVIQLAATIAAIVVSQGAATPWLATGILAAGSIISGVLYAKAAAMDAITRTDDPQVDVATNSFSLTNVTNEARPLAPVPIVMGSHRVVPDYYARAFPWIYNDNVVVGEQPPIVSSDTSGITFLNGALSATTSWITIPAGFVEDNGSAYGVQYDRFPQYEIRISPYFFGIRQGNLTPELADECRNTFKNLILAMWGSVGGAKDYSSHINFNFINEYDIMALAIYHIDPSDPYYSRPNGERYNILWTIIRAYELNRKRVSLAPSITPTDYNFYSDISYFYSGTFSQYLVSSVPYSYQQTFFRSGNDVLRTSDVDVLTSIPKDLLKAGSLSGYYYPSAVGSGSFIAACMSAIAALLDSLNGFGSLPNVGTRSWLLQIQKIPFGITSVIDEGVEYSTQVFNYGLGDIEVSDRRVGSTEVGLSDSISHYSPINKDFWEIPNFGVVPILMAKFYTKVFRGEDKKLSNINDPDYVVNVTDDNQYNFVKYEGALGQRIIYFLISGRIYSTSTSTGFATNTCIIQIQWKRKSETVWRNSEWFPSVLTIQNDNTKLVNSKLSLGSLDDGFLGPDDCLQVRIRKVTRDSVNNNENKVCDLSVKKFSAVSTPNVDFDPIDAHIPMNLEGLFMTSLLSDSSQTNRYSAMVEAKCWYYNFITDQWVWGKTRNPAWWFLFYARGGFENREADGTFTFPYSPTYGWVNYPDHPDNSVHLFGGGYKDEKIDMDKIFLWAQFCDEKNLKIDLVLKDDTSVADVLERIANVGRASVSDFNSKLSVVFENSEQAATCLFGMGNIKAGSFSVDYLVSDEVSKIIANYVDRTDWETRQVEAVVPFSDPNNLNHVTINLEGITERDQAQRECNIFAARQFFQRRSYSFEVDIEGLLVKRGDLAYISHDSTQYGISARVREFIFENGVIIGIKSNAVVNESIEHITIRDPAGVLRYYPCSASGNDIIFEDDYPLSLAPYYISNVELNNQSSFYKSIAEDFIFIAGEKETSGKIVRISAIDSLNEFDFKITAVDEDPAMWSYEYGDIEPPESFNDSEVELIVEDAFVEYLENGKIKVLWSGKNVGMVQIINKQNNLPVEGDGSYTFSNGSALLELSAGGRYELEVRPFAVGTPFKSVSKEVVAWPQ